MENNYITVENAYRLSTLTGSLLGSICANILDKTTKVAQVGIGIVREINSAFLVEVSPVYKQSRETITNEFSKLVK